MLESELKILVDRVSKFRKTVPQLVDTQVNGDLEQNRPSLKVTVPLINHPAVEENEVINPTIFNNFESNMKETTQLMGQLQDNLPNLIERAQRVNLVVGETATEKKQKRKRNQ